MTRWSGCVVCALLAILVVLSVACLGGCRTSDFLLYKMAPTEPDRDADRALAGLSAPVEIVFDRDDVPHVRAQNDADLSFGIGYLHGRDRLFQMTLSRAAAYGRLCELFGNRETGKATDVFPDLLAMDRWFRTIGLYRHGADAAARLTPEERALAEAYVAGINAAAEREPLPIEFKLLRQDPTPWTVEDVMTVARLQAWFLMTNAPMELIRFLMAAERGEDWQRETYPSFDPPGAAVIEAGDLAPASDASAGATPEQSASTAEPFARADWAKAARAVLSLEVASREWWGAPKAAASNSFALAPTRTKSGAAIVANDPHLRHAAPGTFYLMHQSTPEAEAVGVTFPGVPFLVLGHNHDVAWTATTTFADMQDLYLEKPDPADPTRYLVPGGSEPYQIDEQVIRVRRDDGGFDEVHFPIRSTRHGRVLSDAEPQLLPPSAPVLALKTTLDGAGGDVAAMRALMRAKNVREAIAAYRLMDVPIQNWMAGDRDGHIAYFPAGRIPRRVGWDGSAPVPGWTGQYEWGPWIAPSDMPFLADPTKGYLVTANNKVLDRTTYPWPFSNDPMPSYRATRLTNLISGAGKLDAAAAAAMQVDTHVQQAEGLLPVLLAALDGATLDPVEQKAVEALRAWDLNADVDSTGAAIFFTTHRHAWRLTLADDLSPGLFDLTTQSAYDYAFFDRLWTEAPSAAAWDDRATPEREDRDAILRRAFSASVAGLRKRFGDDPSAWRWGALHRLTFHHAMGGVEELSSLFDAGPYEVPGAADTVFAESYTFHPSDDESYEVKFGPAFRMVVDFGDPEAGGMIVDMGASGRPGTRTYAEYVEDWKAGRLRPISMDPARYRDGATGTLRLAPAAK